MAARWTCWCTTQGRCRLQYLRTDEGFEATYASQVLSQHVLTTRLLPALQRGASPRVIVVSSGGMYAERLDPADGADDGRRATTACGRTRGRSGPR